MLSRFFGERIGGVASSRSSIAPRRIRRQLPAPRAAACLPCARLSGDPPHLRRRCGHPQTDPAQPLRDLAPREEGQSRAVAALAGPGRRSRSFGASSGLGGRLRGRCSCSRLPRVRMRPARGESDASARRSRCGASDARGRDRAPRLPPPPPPPPPTARHGIRAALGPPLEVEETRQPRHHPDVRISRSSLPRDESGTSSSPDRQDRRVLDKEGGSVKVVGHTDSTPIRGNLRFPSNFHLSVERAQPSRIS